MKVNKWSNFLNRKVNEEKDMNIRDDDDAYLNDPLHSNDDDDDDDDDDYSDILWRDYPKSSSSGVKKFKDFDDWGDDDIDYYKGKAYSAKDDDEIDTDTDDYNNNLSSMLRTMFLRAGVTAEVEHDNDEILITCKMKRTENIKDVIEVFEIIKKIKKDILAQYDSEFEIFTKGGNTDLMFGFYIGDGLGDDSNEDAPF